ncbi:MAG: tape measure protein, partial [Planctomycetales bacterium]|nr:tape measure protein [Planctomycetales bacterium]
LEAKLDKYNANLRRAEQNFARSVGSQQADIRRLEAQIARSSGGISNSLKGLAATFAAAFSVQQIAALADGYTRFANQLAVAGVEGANFAEVQDALFATAQRNGVALESLGTLYSRGAQVANELGASQAELLQFTNGVAAALRIQGTSATEAQGALLQLSQALGSGTVRAEEFNSINEGALPILQAVARNLDAAGGSVARLKALVNDGQVSSEQFFRAFLAGTADLEEQASNAALTIGNSFTVLNNALGLYIGQTDDAYSATERISQAIILLSENLGTVTNALAVLAAILLGRYVAGAAAAAAATGVTSTAIFALQARAVGAATTMEALALTSATAGRAMLAAFGGPVGLAVTALALGFVYLSTQVDSAEESLQALNRSADEAAAEADAMEARLRAAGVAMYQVDEASGEAAGGLTGVSNAARAAKTD